jgi:hypothetical protein
MSHTSVDSELLLAANRHGRTCGLAAVCQRDLQTFAVAYRDLFPATPFDSVLFNTLALANAFCAPHLTADEPRIANRTALWATGLDWLVDHVVTSRNGVQAIVDRCLAAADGVGREPTDNLARCLADIREDLGSAAAFTFLRPTWRDELRRMLAGMALEWEWKSAAESGKASLPTFDEYLRNSDNFGFAFVYVSHWAFTSEPHSHDHIDKLRAAGWEVQRVIRLVNDLGTHYRDVKLGDLNALMLGLTRDEVNERIASLTVRCQELINGVRPTHPYLADYLERMIGFNRGFYHVTDYWGTQ